MPNWHMISWLSQGLKASLHGIPPGCRDWIASTSNYNFSLKASVAPVLTTARDPQDHVKAHLAAS